LPVQRALHEAAVEARERHGVAIRWLPDAVRQLGPDAAARVLEAAVAAGRGLGVVGFGIGGDETAIPATAFAGVCAGAWQAGLGVTIHAGETGGPDAVRDAVLECGATRIGHGIGAVLGPVIGWEDPAGRGPVAVRAAPEPDEIEATLALLAARRVFVELCPGSNRVTGVLGAAAYPLRAFLGRGIPCCLNTDDRGLFGLDLRGEYGRAAAAHALSSVEIATMQSQAAAASFAEPRLDPDPGSR
jgi:adenosine deaminase